MSLQYRFVVKKTKLRSFPWCLNTTVLPFSWAILFCNWLKGLAAGGFATFMGTDEPTWRRDLALLF